LKNSNPIKEDIAIPTYMLRKNCHKGGHPQPGPIQPMQIKKRLLEMEKEISINTIVKAIDTRGFHIFLIIACSAENDDRKIIIYFNTKY
jgi:hypothetical protein